MIRTILSCAFWHNAAVTELGRQELITNLSKGKGVHTAVCTQLQHSRDSPFGRLYPCGTRLAPSCSLKARGLQLQAGHLASFPRARAKQLLASSLLRAFLSAACC